MPFPPWHFADHRKAADRLFDPNFGDFFARHFHEHATPVFRAPYKGRRAVVKVLGLQGDGFVEKTAEAGRDAVSYHAAAAALLPSMFPALYGWGPARYFDEPTFAAAMEDLGPSIQEVLEDRNYPLTELEARNIVLRGIELIGGMKRVGGFQCDFTVRNLSAGPGDFRHSKLFDFDELNSRIVPPEAVRVRPGIQACSGEISELVTLGRSMLKYMAPVDRFDDLVGAMHSWKTSDQEFERVQGILRAEVRGLAGSYSPEAVSFFTELLFGPAAPTVAWARAHPWLRGGAGGAAVATVAPLRLSDDDDPDPAPAAAPLWRALAQRAPGARWIRARLRELERAEDDLWDALLCPWWPWCACGKCTERRRRRKRAPKRRPSPPRCRRLTPPRRRARGGR